MGLAPFILAVIIIIAGIGALAVAFKSDEGHGVAALILLVGVLTLLMDSFTIVGSKDVAVQTSFGK